LDGHYLTIFSKKTEKGVMMTTMPASIENNKCARQLESPKTTIKQREHRIKGL
jgi:hypothetical protein